MSSAGAASKATSKVGSRAPRPWQAPPKKTSAGCTFAGGLQTWGNDNTRDDYVGTEASGSVPFGGGRVGVGGLHPHQAQGPKWAVREARAMEASEARMRGGRPTGPLKQELDPAV